MSGHVKVMETRLKGRPRFAKWGGEGKVTFFKWSNRHNFGLRGRMEVWVGALGRYAILGCAWDFLGCFASACTYVHAFEKKLVENGQKLDQMDLSFSY